MENTSKQYEREREIAKLWKEKDVVKRSERGIKKNFWTNLFPKQFKFLDGPPFANGDPHFGHLLQSIIKDIIPRYKTMRGYKVPRRWGWDCHGLPVEVEIEKDMNINSKREIEEMGIELFNKKARESVLLYADNWKAFIDKIGRSIFMDDAYRTMDTEYIEGVWDTFKKIFDKGHVHRGLRPSHFCPRCETVLSNTEVAEGYQDVDDLSAYVLFPTRSDKSVSFVAWTTTPWTLLGNLALAINPEIVYVKILYENHTYIISKVAFENLNLFEGGEVVEEAKGDKLIGTEYVPPFQYLINETKSDTINKVYAADFVTTEVGTGIVHIAPPYGADDFNLAKKHNLPIKHHVDKKGRVMSLASDFVGKKVKAKENRIEFDKEIVEYLRERAILLKEEMINHSYPHCWRCKTPLLYYASETFFINSPKYKEKMIKANKKVNWVPKEIGEKRFGNWLKETQLWAFARSRFWGAPIPIWMTKDGKMKVFGSIEEIKNAMPPAKNTYLTMRHGQAIQSVDQMKEKGYNLSKDEDVLTDKGVEEVKEKAKQFKNHGIDLIVYSPMRRTKQTAELVNDVLQVEMKEDERLREIGMNAIHGTENETTKNLFSRLVKLMYELEEKYEGRKILIVTHHICIKSLIAISKGYSFENKYDLKRFEETALKVNEIKTTGTVKCDFKALPRNDENMIDFHRPYIDRLKLYENGEELKRVEEVFDCWFESGAGLFVSQKNFGSIKRVDRLAPVDFVGEAIDQTRGWFYSLMNVSTGAYDVLPYKNVLCSGLIMADDGKKMSKSSKNYSSPDEILEKYCADAVRYYLTSSPVVRAQPLSFNVKILSEVQRKVIDRLHNVLQFYLLYTTEEVGSDTSKNVIDRWIISRLAEVREEVTEGLETYQLDKATRPIGEFIEDLSVWYVRRSRERIKGSDAEAIEARKTLKFVLLFLSKLIAPIMPFYAEYLYQKVDGEKDSVHLLEWPGKVKFFDKKLLENMQQTRSIVSILLELRENAEIKVRQPLKSATLKTGAMESNEGLLCLIKEEVNVKEVLFAKQEEVAKLDTNITEDLRKEGVVRDVIRVIQTKRKTAKLKPTDKIALALTSDNDTQKIVEENEKEIKNVAGVTKIEYHEGELEAEIIS